jgi:hypothetical protein
MDELKSRLEVFKGLAFEIQKEKLIAMLEWLKKSDQIFEKLLNVVQKNTKIDSDFLSNTYWDIIYFANAVATNNKKESLDMFDNIKSKIQKIYELEKIETLKDNSDNILNQI